MEIKEIPIKMELVDGTLKLKRSFSTVCFLCGAMLFILYFGCAFFYGLLNQNIEYIIMPPISIFSFSYLLFISAYGQRSSNY